MKHWLKSVPLILCLLVSLSILAACGGSAPASVPAGESVTVSSSPAAIPPSVETQPAPEAPDDAATEESVPSVPPVADVTSIPAQSAFTGDFSIEGMWETSGGRIITFGGDGQCSPTLFGFDGGPNGSYALSSKTDENGYYTLSATHITGGSLVYKVMVTDADTITLTAEGETYFSASQYALSRM